MSSDRRVGRGVRTIRAMKWVAHSLICTVLLVPGSQQAALASAAESAPGSADISLAPQGIPVPSGSPSRTMWTWAAQGRGYFLAGENQIHSVELASGKTTGSGTIVPAYYNDPGNGQPEMVAVDEEGGRLFVATRSTHVRASLSGGVVGAGAVLADTLNGTTCVSQAGGAGWDPCLNGIAILDAASLEQTGFMALRSLQMEAAPLSPELVALAYSPPPSSEDSGKVHMMVQEFVNHGTQFVEQASPRIFTGQTVTYLAQFDPATQRQDWIVRVEACRGHRETRSNYSQVTGYPYQGAIIASNSVADPAVYVACHSNASSITAVVVKIPLDREGRPATLPVAADDPVAHLADGESPGSAVQQANGQHTVVGPDKVHGLLADPVSGRFLMQVRDGSPLAMVYWVFDTVRMQFVGTIGIGSPITSGMTMSGIDPVKGRLYVLAARHGSFPGGLFSADIRREPLPQALVYPEFAALVQGVRPQEFQEWGLTTVSPSPDGSTSVYFPDHVSHSTGSSPEARTKHLALVDRRPLTTTVEGPAFAGRTLDLEEIPGVTATSLDGAARGYGFRALLLGGAEAAMRVGPADPVGILEHCDASSQQLKTGDAGNPVAGDSGACQQHAKRPFPNSCLSGDRELILGLVGVDGPAIVDQSGARGTARPVTIDSITKADGEAPVSRCTESDWQQLWSTGLFGGAPIEEPRAAWAMEDVSAECLSSSNDEERVGDPVAGGFSAAARCAEEESSGHSYARGIPIPGIRVLEAVSSYRIYRDPARGIVSRVESVVHGIDIGVAHIDTVRGIAESWANGRAQPVAADEREPGYEANCDHERSAGTCYQKHLLGLRTPMYSCGPCGDEERVTAAINRALTPNMTVQFRHPDPVLARGAENGYIAAIQKPDSERFSDLILNSDFMEAVMPTLEIIRYAPPNRIGTGGGPRGRQIYQFAGVEVSSSYGIQCLLVYDEATRTCGAAQEELGALTISLTDPDGAPLAGGAFEVRRDSDEDGALGLVDELLPEGACVTAEDGTGTCTFENLQPGPYLVSQTAAPPVYSRVEEPWVTQVSPGEARTVKFTNASSVSVVEVTATDAAGAPLEGAQFAAYPDMDADGKVAPDAQPAAQCTTDASGTCSMRVPAGTWVLVQMSAPGGLEPIEPVAFALTSGGQTAAVGIVNYPAQAPAAPAPAPAPVYSDPPAMSARIERVTEFEQAPPMTDEGPVRDLPAVAGDTIVRIIRAPGDAIRLLNRDLKQAVAWTAAILLLALAGIVLHRRARLVALLAPSSGLAWDGPSDRGAPPNPERPPSAPRLAAAKGRTPRPHVAATADGSTAQSGERPSRSDSRASAGVAVLDRPHVAGAAPAVGEHVTARVLLACADLQLASLAAEKVAASAECELVAVTHSIAELMAQTRAHRPDVVVVDLALRSAPSEDICDVLPSVHPPARTIGIIPPGRSLQAIAIRGYRVGLGGLLVAYFDMGNGQLSYAIRCVASGKSFYGPTVQAVMLERRKDERGQTEQAVLTSREKEVALLAASGSKRSEIAEQLFLSPFTVKRHLHSIRNKLGVTNPWDREQLRRRLEESGLIEDGLPGDAT